MKPDKKKVSEGELAILSMVSVATSRLSESLEVIKEQNEALLKKNQEQHNKIDYLVKAQEAIAKKELDKLEKQRLFKSRKRLQERDTISFLEFKHSLTLVSTTKTLRLQVSIKLGLALMYFFGIRISNCLTLNNDFFTELLNNTSSVSVPQIKTGKVLEMLKPNKAVVEEYFKPHIQSLRNLLGSEAETVLIPYFRSY
jgi:hypothetical protein